MKGIILYSSNTGNTKKLAEKIYENIHSIGDWTIHSIDDKGINIEAYDVLLFGGWAEGGSFNKQASAFLSNLDLTDKKVGFFMTMGARTNTEHGKFCEQNLLQLAKKYHSIGVRILQGHIAAPLMKRLSELPDTAIPVSVKTAMQDGALNYKEPSDEDYEAITNYFIDRL